MEHSNVGNSDSNSKGSGSGSGACIITVKDETEHSPKVDKEAGWLANKMRQTTDEWTSVKPQIPKVPQTLRNIDGHNKCFDPVVLSIGPYHHGKPELAMAENLKIACTQQFVSDCDLSNIIFCSKIEYVATKAKDYYDRSMVDQLDHEAFTWMMFVDGCFTLHFIDCCINGIRSELDKHLDILTHIWRDLFLLENQLPYIVLKALMSLRYTEDRWKEILNKWFDSIVCPEGLSSNEDGGDKKPPPGDLIQTKYKGDGEDDKQKPLNHFDFLRTAGPKARRDLQQPLHLLDLLRTKLLGSCVDDHMPCLSRSEFLKWRSYPSISELISVGINVKRSGTSCLTDIHFRSNLFGGELLLPRIVVGSNTKERFLNLVAYEMGKDTRDFGVSSYICFMDTIIDNADDVKELWSKRILYSWLGNNEQVADLFNKLGVGLVPDHHAYAEVIKGIDKYYESKLRVSIGKFMHTHFRGPWSIIATIAAGFTILLTCIQTIYSLLK